VSTQPVPAAGHPPVPPVPVAGTAARVGDIGTEAAVPVLRPRAEEGDLFVRAAGVGVDTVHRSYLDGLLRAHLVAVWVARCWPAPPPPELTAPTPAPAPVKPTAATGSRDHPGRPPGWPLHDGLRAAATVHASAATTAAAAVAAPPAERLPVPLRRRSAGAPTAAPVRTAASTLVPAWELLRRQHPALR
jgi:hypothetical protein